MFFWNKIQLYPKFTGYLSVFLVHKLLFMVTVVISPSDRIQELATKAGLEVFQCEYIHRRTLNKKEGLSVPRIFVQGKFVKQCVKDGPPEDSCSDNNKEGDVTR